MTASTVTKMKNVNKKKGEKAKKSLSVSKQNLSKKGGKANKLSVNKQKGKNPASGDKMYPSVLAKKKRNKKKLKSTSSSDVHKGVVGKKKKKTKSIVLVDQKKENEEEGGIDIASSVVNQAIEGVRVLTKQKQDRGTNKKDLLDDGKADGDIFLQVGMVKVANLLERTKHIVRPVKIKVFLPHSIVNSNTEVLLITKDDNNKKDIRDDHTENLHHYQHKLRICGAARHINEVITLRQLKVEFKEYEAKRHLANRVDVVLCDDTIIRRIPMFLGKHFYGKNKIPIQVNLKSRNLLAEIERALTIQVLSLPMTGNSGIMKIGNLDQTNKMIEDNIQAAIDKFKRKFPGGLQNIQSLSLKTGRTKSIPIYAKISSINDIGEIVPKPLSNRAPVSGEVSSTYGDVYTVYPDNNVQFVKSIPTSLRDRREQRRGKKEEQEILEKKPESKEGSMAKKNHPGSKDVKEDESAKKKKKRVSGEILESETPKKKKKGSGFKSKKGKRTEGDMESGEDEELDKMERDYLKRISMELEEEKSEGKMAEKNVQVAADDEEDDDDDWAEVSDDDMSSGFNDEI